VTRPIKVGDMVTILKASRLLPRGSTGLVVEVETLEDDDQNALVESDGAREWLPGYALCGERCEHAHKEAP